ncbi:hypothetical protein [Haloprofundus salilacus]|uniref:hypothetical protein n=1 Tax=Haloprofundus salilacus TaxID=2876190 RepID=UPI001CC9F62E|nr:hypothetical protein [Haloprofundus salilacus]
MASARRQMSNTLGNYAHLRTVPAFIGIFFAVASLYSFGGISSVELVWLEYTLTTQHASLGSLGAYVLAFASSDTKSFDRYEDWEKVAITAGPAVILGNQYVGMFADAVADSTALAVIAFIATIVSWGVAVR